VSTLSFAVVVTPPKEGTSKNHQKDDTTGLAGRLGKSLTLCGGECEKVYKPVSV